jgi:uncharacterized membrane protein YhhN
MFDQGHKCLWTWLLSIPIILYVVVVLAMYIKSNENWFLKQVFHLPSSL